MKFLKKVQKLPEKTRKVILWSIVMVFAVVLLAWWVNNFQRVLSNFDSGKFTEQFNLPDFETSEEMQAIKETLKDINGQ